MSPPESHQSGADRLRVVYLSHCAQLSGAELALVRLLPALQDAVKANVILAEDGPLVGELRGSGVRVEVMALPESARGLTRQQVRPGRLPGASVAQVVRHSVLLAGRLRRLQPDLVHTNSLKAGVYGGLAARLARVPAVWHLHDRVADDYLSPSGVRLIRFLLRTLPTTVIVNSESTLATVAGLGLSADVIAYPVPPWVLDEEVAQGPRSADVRSFRVGMVGRLAPWKGQHVFLDAFARAFPTDGAVAVIVGSAMFGESEYEDRLREQVVRLRLEDRVEMTGFRSDVNDQLRRLDVLVHASIVPEPFGQVVVEGMAAGLPVVAARAGGPAEVITDGHDGVLYPMGDADALASVLRHLAADPATRSALGAAARVRAADFAPEAIAGQVLAVYAMAVSQARSTEIRQYRRPAMPAPDPTTSALELTMFSLHVDSIAGRVVTALRQQGVRALLLKGASVARWLHDDGGLRPYRDVDLLVAPTSLARARDVLRRLGYAPRYSDSASGLGAGHAHEWDQTGWPTVDLHHTLEGVRASPAACWAVLSARTRPLTVGGTEVEVLEIPALAFNLALHAADSGGDRSDGPAGRKRQKALNDLSLAVDRLALAGWTEALAIADELEATAAFGVGLRLDQRGAKLADELGIPTSLTVELVLRASSESELALPFDRLAAAVGPRAKGQIVIRELVPSGAFLRRWWPPAGRGHLWLVVGYLFRFVWITAHAPRGLWLWVRARRVVAAHRDH